MAVTIENTATAFNRYVATFSPEVITKTRQGLVTESFLGKRVADHTWVGRQASIGNLIQAYQCNFTPNNNESFDEERTPLQKMKIDLQWSCDDMDNFFDTFMNEWDETGSGKRPDEWAFPRWVYTNLVVPKMIEEMELSLVYKAVRVAPTPGTAGALTGACDGLGKKIADAITASRITPITTGALTSVNAVDKVKTFIAGLPELHRSTAGNIYMSPTNARYVADILLDTYKTNANIDPMADITKLRVPNTNKTIVGLPSMEGQGRIIYSNRENMVVVRRRGEAAVPVMRFESFERTVKGLCEFHRGYGFEFGTEMFVNDQA
jgi:hypothetical protein